MLRKGILAFAVIMAVAACGSSGHREVAAGKSATPSTSPSGASPSSAPPTTSSPSPSPAPTIPGVGNLILPGHRVVALYGASVTPPDDALGDAGSPASAAAEVKQRVADYASGGEPVVGAFELISTIIQADPGPDGDHAADIELSTIEKYETEAQKDGLLLILDIQPGTSHYLPHIQRLQQVLMQPNVSIALDPEWQFLSGGYQDATGSSPASEINDVSSWLSDFVEQHHLPQKLLVLHQFTSEMITDRAGVENRPGLAVVMHIDGIGNSASGGNAAKIGDYKTLHGTGGQFSGFKLFLKEDASLMSPAEVLKLSPAPDLITYQ